MIKLIVLTSDETMRNVWEHISKKCPTLVTKMEVPSYIPGHLQLNNSDESDEDSEQIQQKGMIVEISAKEMIQDLLNIVISEVLFIVDNEFTVPPKPKITSPYYTKNGVKWLFEIANETIFQYNSPGHTQYRPVGFVGIGNVFLPDHKFYDEYSPFFMKVK